MIKSEILLTIRCSPGQIPASPGIQPPPKILERSTASPGSAPLTENPDGSLEFFLGSKNLKVQIVCGDITEETADLIMHVTNRKLAFVGGVGKALIQEGGSDIVQEFLALGKPALFSTQYTTAGMLAVNQIAHVIGPGKPSLPVLKKCLDNFFDDISHRNIAEISFSAIGAGAMGFSESQSAKLIFDNLSWISESRISILRLVRIVILDQLTFDKYKDAAKDILSNTQQTIQIYSDDLGNIDRAWDELKRRICANIEEKIIYDVAIKKLTDQRLDELRKLERDYDAKIVIDQSKGCIKIKGHISDVSNIQEEIHKLLKEISENEVKGKLV